MLNSSPKKERIFAFDLLRTLACIMVITIHSPMPTDSSNGLFLSTISYLAAPCIGMLFMISGALLLPIKETSTFIKRRFTRIVYPTLFWSLFYITMNIFTKGNSLETVIKQILSIPFSPQGNSILWFMYTMMGVYLASPILSRWIERTSKREIEFYLILWGISLCYPLFESFLVVSTGSTSILYYFSGYLGYYVLGYYLKTYPTSIKNKWVVLSCVIALIAPVLCKLLHWEVNFYTVFWNLSIFVAALSLGWYFITNRMSKYFINERVKDYIILFSNLSLGIYLVHMFILRTILWHCDWIVNIECYVCKTIVIILLTAFLAFLVCLLLSYLPKSEYVIGFHRKKND